jgi:hypothetical protein
MLSCLLQKIRRKWMLIWLLPYLAFCIGGEAMHNHSPFLPEGAPHWHAVEASHSTHQGSHFHEHSDAASSSTVHLHGVVLEECFACLWECQTTAIFAVSLAIGLCLLPVLRFVFPVSSARRERFSLFAVRGPPGLWFCGA